MSRIRLTMISVFAALAGSLWAIEYIWR